MKHLIAVLVLCLTLSACAVVELAVHGVKEYDRSRVQDSPLPEGEPRPQMAQQDSGQRIQAVDTRAEPTQAVPPRESVNVESLK
jgi:hypothetical protein